MNMYGVLLKKQLAEFFCKPAGKNKKGKFVSKMPLLGYVFIYLLVFVSLSAFFYAISAELCAPLVNSGMDWIYLSYMFLTSIIVCMFGTVFNCYSTLYRARDNDLLLSMPIKPMTILAVRLTVEFLLSLFFALMVMGPAIFNWAMCVTLDGVQIVTAVVMTLATALIGVVLGTLLAFFVAVITSHIKTNHTTLLIVILSISAMVLYYYGIYKAEGMLAEVISNSIVLGEKLEGSTNFLYFIGTGMAGNIRNFVIVLAAVLVLFTLLCVILAKSFYRLATANKGGTKIEYKEKKARQENVELALVRKEIGKFTSSANYILNGAMTGIILVIGAIILAIKKDAVQAGVLQIVSELPEGMYMKDVCAIVICMALTMLMGTTNITPCSVSLERDNLWILKSSPISAWQVLKGKLATGLLISGPCALIGMAGACYALEPGIKNVFLLFVFLILYTLFINQVGLMFGLMFPKLNWTNETAAIKQSVSVLLTMGSGVLITVVLFLIFATGAVPANIMLLGVIAILALLDIGVYFWLKKKGTAKFEKLGSE